MKTRSIWWFLLAFFGLGPVRAWAGPCVNTDTSLFCVTSIAPAYNIPGGGGTPTVSIMVHFVNEFAGTKSEWQFLQIRFSDSQDSAIFNITQDKITSPGQNIFWKSVSRPYLPGVEGPPYQVQIQGCFKPLGSSSQCTGWTTVNYTPPPPSTTPTCGTGFIAQPCPTPSPTTSKNQHASTQSSSNGLQINPNNLGKLKSGTQQASSKGLQINSSNLETLKTGNQQQASSNGYLRANSSSLGKSSSASQKAAGVCKRGFVLRDAYKGDKVCVTPQTRQQVEADNRAAAQRRAPNGLCIKGYVWRRADPQDHVCVTAGTRKLTAEDNSQSSARLAAK